MGTRFVLCLAAAAAWSLTAGCSSGSGFGSDATVDTGVVDAAVMVTDQGPPPAPAPVLVGVEPAHGPFLGGTQVTIRGVNFTSDAVVHFGTAMAQPAYTMVIDDHRIAVVTPANNPGDVDVTVDQASGHTVLPGGYHYDAFYVDPATGPLTGGARVSLHGSGTHFADGMSVTFDSMPCTMVQVTSPSLLDCLTPPHFTATVPVTTTAGSETITVPDAYAYADNTNGSSGGLSGGMVNGSLTVSVINSATGSAIPSAFVFLNNTPGAVPPSAGLTDAMGQVTLAPPGLMAPVTVTAAAHCFTTATIQSFNAAAASVYLSPLMLPSCGHGGAPNEGQTVLAARITGQLVWSGPNETAPNPWDNLPVPRTGERRVSFVYASRADIFEADPQAIGVATVYEVVPHPIHGPGYPFTIEARPAAVAVYAIAGIQNTSTMAFTPYLMGVARDVLGSPGATVSGVLVPMDIALSHEMPAHLHDLPVPESGMPNTLQGNVFLDLGGEGVIPFPSATVHGVSADESYVFEGLPGLMGTIADGRFTVHFRYASGAINGPTPFGADMTTGQPDTPAPMSALILQGITTPDDTLDVGNWLGIPDLTVPTEGGALPADRTVHFTVPGVLPDVYLLTLQWDSGTWQHFAPGTITSMVYPDLSSLMGLSDIPAGSAATLSLVGLRIPGFNFNQFTYTGLGQDYWTAYAGKAVLVTR